MAGRPKKPEPSTVETNEETKTASTEESRLNVEDLIKENSELREQLALTLQKLEKVSLSTDEDVSAENSLDHEFVEINPMKPIRVVSLSDGGVNLKTSGERGGKIFRLDKFGHSISITYADLQDVIATCRSFIEDGTVYICDKNVVRNNYLDEYYKKFLTVDTITNILSFDKDRIVDMVKNTTVPIQETIISLICSKINKGEYVDMNKVDAIGKACKTPCDIMALAMQKRVQQ